MASNTLTVAAYTFKDAIRARWLIVFAILFFLLAVNLPGLRPFGRRLSLAELLVGVYSISYRTVLPIPPSVALPMGVPSIVEERENGTLHSFFPIRYREMHFLAEKYWDYSSPRPW